MRQFGILSLIVCLAASAGCNVCCWGKRASELGSPTDIRKSHFWCLGEDAIFEQPCGPSKEDYGLKTTCWREWPADGGRCQPGSCPAGDGCIPERSYGPAMLPAIPPQHAAPRDWENATPTEVIESPNPFHDDEPTLPVPSTSGALPRSPQVSPQSAAFKPHKQSPQRIALGVTAPTIRAERLRSKPPVAAATATLSSPATTKLSARTKPLTITASTDTAAKRPTEEQPLKIAVSKPVDAPARSLASIAPPQGLPKPNVSQQKQPQLEAVTLAGLERMIEVPAARVLTDAPPLVVRNDYSPQPKSFNLATRTTLTRAANDPELKKETLSALESMIESGTSPASAK